MEDMFSGIVTWFEGVKAEFILNFVEKSRWKMLLTGLENTILITMMALCIGIGIGVMIAVIRCTWETNGKKMRPSIGKALLSLLNKIGVLYTTIIRGTPVVVQLLILYYIIFASSSNGMMVAVLSFGLNSGAYVAEIIRSGIMSIDNGQFEAGRSLGFNYPQTMIYIILPQALKNVLPALANEFIVLLKETSVAGYIGLVDLTKAGTIIQSRTYEPFLPLIAVALIYLALVMLFTKLVSMLERRLRNSER